MQVRQKVSHKKTFLFLEQLILKHNAHDATLQIKTLPDGIDFYFAQRSHALRFIDFVDSVMSVRSKSSKQLVSADLKNNDYNYKFNYMVEIVPICKHDLMAIPKVLANIYFCIFIEYRRRFGGHFGKTVQIAINRGAEPA